MSETSAKTRVGHKIFPRILLRALQLFGIVVFIHKPEGVETSKFLIILTASRILSFYIPPAVFSLCILLDGRLKMSTLLTVTETIWTVAIGILGFTICSDATVKRKEHKNLYMNILIFDMKLAELEESVSCKRHDRFIMSLCLVKLITFLLLSAGQGALHWKADLSYYSLYPAMFFVTALIHHNLFSITVISYMKIIMDRYKELNRLLFQLLNEFSVEVIRNSESKKKSLHVLSNACHLHHFMTKTVKLFNEAFGSNLVIFFSVAFVNIVMGLFCCSSAYHREQSNWNMISSNLLIAVSCATDIIHTCHLGQYAIEEAKKSGLLIHKIETSDYDMKDEIEMFSLQIANEKVEFNAAGFFPINYTLVFSIIGGVTTYLIILIQLAANKSINP